MTEPQTLPASYEEARTALNEDGSLSWPTLSVECIVMGGPIGDVYINAPRHRDHVRCKGTGRVPLTHDSAVVAALSVMKRNTIYVAYIRRRWYVSDKSPYSAIGHEDLLDALCKALNTL